MPVTHLKRFECENPRCNLVETSESVGEGDWYWVRLANYETGVVLIERLFCRSCANVCDLSYKPAPSSSQ